jgi:hypothetical protein
MFHVKGKKIPDWKYLMHNFPIAVMFRPGYREGAKKSVAACYGAKLFEENPLHLGREKIGWTFVDNEPMDVSSTAVKEDLARHERDIEGLLPEAEQAIYDRGLFGTGETTPPPLLTPNNSVCFHTFLLLAATAHSCKSAAKNSFSSPDFSSYIDYFIECWEIENTQAGSTKSDKIPIKLSDCLISLYRIAASQGITLSTVAGAQENQHSVVECYNGSHTDLHGLIFKNIQTFAHICVCEGLEKQRAVNLLRIAFETEDSLDPATAHRNNLEVIKNYADAIKINLADSFDSHMAEKRLKVDDRNARQTMKPNRILEI